MNIAFTEGMATLIQARLTPQAAHEAMITARRYGGRAALAAGIVDCTADEDAVRGTAIKIARAEVAKAGPVLGAIKSTMYAPVLKALQKTDTGRG